MTTTQNPNHAERKIEIAKQRNATDLALNSSRLKHCPESVGELTVLRSLNLSLNQLTAFPEPVRNLKKLRLLVLRGNRIMSLPDWIDELSELSHLYLAHNGIALLPPSIGNLQQLRTLDLSSNRLVSLPESLNRLPNLNRLSLGGNAGLGLPEEILRGSTADVRSSSKSASSQGAKVSAILDYYFRTQRGNRPLNEAKIILVGRGSVGKTCLIKRLVHQTFDEHEPETPGIEIRNWEIDLDDDDRVRLHVWDFGGQEILHATHQLFLTERTIYLLVLSGREGTATQDAEYWLQLIRSFGGDSQVLIALNKSVQHPFDVNRGLLLEKYSRIAGFVQTDCSNTADGEIAPAGTDSFGIAKLRNQICDLTSSLEHRKADFPNDWFAIKERLSSMDENYLTWDQYQEICRVNGEVELRGQKNLARTLHYLGISLNYSDDPRLRDTHVLNPRWVTEGIYSLLRAGQNSKGHGKGVLEIGDLSSALSKRDYPRSTHAFLLHLMENFQLCFRLPGSTNRYLVPELLSENQPSEIALLLTESELGFRYQYEVLPEGLLPRFIVQTHKLSESMSKLRWRSGVVLNRGECQAVVRADTRERRVDVRIRGPERQRRDLLAIIRDKFDEQHCQLTGLEVDERVPVPTESGLTVSHAFLTMLEQEAEEWVRPEGASKRHRVGDLLNGVDSASRRDRRVRPASQIGGDKPDRPAHVFLSYCKDDRELVRELHGGLVAAGENVWWDQDLLGGQDWVSAIKSAIKHSYAFVLCLSSNLEARVRSGVYPEVFQAIREYRSQNPGSIFLIPVRLDDCAIPDIPIDDTRDLEQIQAIDLFPVANREVGIQKLLDSLMATPHYRHKLQLGNE